MPPELTPSWEGYTVIKRISYLVYTIQRSPKGKMTAVHLDRLMAYHSDKESDWYDLKGGLCYKHLQDVVVLVKCWWR